MKRQWHKGMMEWNKTWIDCGEIGYAFEEPVTTLVGSPCSGVE
jgi:hypothetical protein